MKTEKIKKFRIIDKEYLFDNIVEIKVEEDDNCIVITYFYDRDGQTKVERYLKDKLKLYSAIWEEIK